MKPNVKPLIDDYAAVHLRNKVYEAQDAREECDKISKELNGYSTWSCIHERKFAGRALDDVVEDVKRTVADLEKKKRQYERAERAAYLELGEQILKLVPPPPFSDSPLDIPVECYLTNGDCYLFLNFIDFLAARKLMPELTLHEAKKLLLDFDCDMGACD